MEPIRPALKGAPVVCVESCAPPGAMVVFGASGDLVRRKLLLSLFELFKADLIGEQFYVIGCGRKKLSDGDFRNIAVEAIKEKGNKYEAKTLKAFTDRLYYIAGNYDSRELYEDIKRKSAELGEKYKTGETIVFYLSVPPFLYSTIVDNLGSCGLSGRDEPEMREKIHLVVEKPFGRDLESASELNNIIRRYFDESQIYRIDHYLGKETVQNILIFRFANSVFEPVWNRNYIDNVQITIAESLGIGHRGSYYDRAGALRDMFQNHMLQMLALVAMEPPASFKAEHIRNEKVKLFSSIRAFEVSGNSATILRGQYGPGNIGGKKVNGYLDEAEVEPDSKTETYVAAKLFIDNWRWEGVPFYLRTGKRLSDKDTEIVINFKAVPHSMFVSADIGEVPANVLILQIQPQEGITLSFQAKRPGSKICMDTLNMQFDYKSVFDIEMPEAYQRLLLDCMSGDQTLFTRYDSVETAWKLLMPVLRAWETDDSRPYPYPAGAESFEQADNIIESDGRSWHKIG